jgi:hypothetical protein
VKPLATTVVRCTYFTKAVLLYLSTARTCRLLHVHITKNKRLASRSSSVDVGLGKPCHGGSCGIFMKTTWLFHLLPFASIMQGGGIRLAPRGATGHQKS